MSEQGTIPNVYSYLKFKEMAEDRMSQVKIFVQNSEDWESSGFGMLHFFQIMPNNNRKELMSIVDLDGSVRNLFAAIEIIDSNSFSEAEIASLKRNYMILNIKNVRLDNVIVFYDLFNGADYDFDFNSKIRRESHQLGAQKITFATHSNEFRLRWNVYQNVGIFVCNFSRVETNFATSEF